MSKTKISDTIKLNSYIKEFGGPDIFSTDGNVLFCQICGKQVSCSKRNHVEQHVNSTRHQLLLNKQNSATTLKHHFISNAMGESSTARKQSEFNLDLCQMLLSANIPLKKLENPTLRSFLTKYCNHPIPSESSIRKNHLLTCYENTMETIRSALRNKYIWVSIDETTDILGRFIVNVIVGILSEDEEETQPSYLLNVVCVEKNNHSTIARIFDDSLKIIDANFDRDLVLLFVTDAAPYMVKAAKGLKVMFLKMIHLTCMAHGIHRVAEDIRNNFRDVDRLISNIKKVFLKAPSRIIKFKEILPNVPLPPQPIITRWGTWLNSVVYVSKYYNGLKTVFDQFDANEAMSIQEVKTLLNSTNLANDVAYISANFGFLPEKIKKLEENSAPLGRQIQLIDETYKKICEAQGEIAVKGKKKMEIVLKKKCRFWRAEKYKQHFKWYCCQ